MITGHIYIFENSIQRKLPLRVATTIGNFLHKTLSYQIENENGITFAIKFKVGISRKFLQLQETSVI